MENTNTTLNYHTARRKFFIEGYNEVQITPTVTLAYDYDGTEPDAVYFFLYENNILITRVTLDEAYLLID